jgi:catechol 2,3-dioxygenase-like lactoylglutathione lyase family enzyme
MLKDSKAFSGFSVDHLEEARRFYGDTLGLDVTVLDESMGLLSLNLASGAAVMVYARPTHQRARDLPGAGPADRVVHRPCRQRPLGARGAMSRKPLALFSRVVEQLHRRCG